VALLTATALLFCHGIYGASHVLAGDGASHASHSGKAPTFHQQGAAHDVPAGHAGSAGGYFAVLLILAGAAMLGLVRAAVLAPIQHGVSRILWSHRRSDARALRPRGPTPPLLQVFRL
jgi:hypothetical protein